MKGADIMYQKLTQKYNVLNQLAEADGTVIFGTGKDVEIPLGELKQAFAIKDCIYNRSFPNLSIMDASRYYRECVSELFPNTVLLHIGEADAVAFSGNEDAFDKAYVELIDTIRSNNKDCRIVIVSQKNHTNDAMVSDMNCLLRDIAADEKCEFEDISAKCSWDIKECSKTSSFLYEIGFDRPLHIKRPIYNLVRILFCYEG